MINRVTLIGSLDRDPEVRSLDAGEVCALRIAYADKWKDRSSGEVRSRTVFFSVSVWGEELVGLGRKLRQGDTVFVEGRLDNRQIKGRDGQQRALTEIVVRAPMGALMRLGSGSSGGRDRDQDRRDGDRRDPPRGENAPSRRDRDYGLDDEIPF